MNNTPYWACVSVYLASIVCPPAAPAEETRQSLSRAFYSEDVDCSGLLPGIPEASVPAPSRIPYGYRWDDYQGAEIEHDVYGDRQRRACMAPHVALAPAVARKFGGLFAMPRPRFALCPVEPQEADQPSDCGCEKLAPPLAPVPVPAPPSIVGPTSEEPVPAEPTPAGPTPTEPTPPAEPLPPRNIVPQPRPNTIPPATSPTRTRHEATSPGLERAPARRLQAADLKPVTPLSQQPVAPPTTISLRLAPIQIEPAVPRAGLPVAKAPEVYPSDSRRNSVPSESAKPAASEKSHVDFGNFFNELLGPRK